VLPLFCRQLSGHHIIMPQGQCESRQSARRKFPNEKRQNRPFPFVKRPSSGSPQRAGIGAIALGRNSKSSRREWPPCCDKAPPAARQPVDSLSFARRMLMSRGPATISCCGSSLLSAATNPRSVVSAVPSTQSSTPCYRDSAL